MKTPIKYCIRLKQVCQYKGTPYCPTNYTHHPEPAPKCKDTAHRILEESLSKEDQ